MRSAARWMLVTRDAQHGCSVVNEPTTSLIPSDWAQAVSRTGCSGPRVASTRRCPARIAGPTTLKSRVSPSWEGTIVTVPSPLTDEARVDRRVSNTSAPTPTARRAWPDRPRARGRCRRVGASSPRAVTDLFGCDGEAWPEAHHLVRRTSSAVAARPRACTSASVTSGSRLGRQFDGSASRGERGFERGEGGDRVDRRPGVGRTGTTVRPRT